MIKNKKGFTLIELLVVIAIITILAAAIVVGINPARHFAAARNAARWSHMNAIATGIYSYAVDNGGAFPVVPVTPLGGFPCIGASGVGNEVDIGTDPALWCADIAGVSLIVPDYIRILPTPPLAGEVYQIQFTTVDEGQIRITSSETEASEVILIQ